jgi:hypothetical protein
MLPQLLLIFIPANLNAGAARSHAAARWGYRIYVVEGNRGTRS